MYAGFSLDQLTAFLAVVEEGSFSAAGRRLGRVQSAVSYAIAQLEAALGCRLFARSGRAPSLTERGRRLAAEARLVLAQARELSECASRLQEEIEPELRVTVDAIFPLEQLVTLCESFQRTFPATTLRVDVGLLGDTVALVRDGGADLGACNLAGRPPPPELVALHLGEVQLVPVCAARHPLATLPQPHRNAALRQFTQIVHSELRGALTRDQGVLASRTWRVTSLQLKTQLILRGLGWGSLPRSVAAPLIASGELKRLRPEPWPPSGHALALHAISREDRALGRAAQWFRTRLTLPSPGGAPANDGAGARDLEIARPGSDMHEESY